MTDEQIMQGLNQCFFKSDTCGECPYKPYNKEQADCLDRLGKDAIALIKRQQAEIEEKNEAIKFIKTETEKVTKLILENRETTLKIYDAYEQRLKTARAEAVKEFADRMKEIAGSSVTVNNGQEIYETKCYNIMAYKLDNLVKEVVGADND